MPEETFEEIWLRLTPITEGASPKEIAELFFQIGKRQSLEFGLDKIDSVSPKAARFV